MKFFTNVLLCIAMLFAACKKNNNSPNTVTSKSSLTKYSATDFTADNLEEYCKLQYYLILEKLYAKVGDSTIMAYNSADLKEELSPYDFDQKHSSMQMVQAPNPASPNDPFDLIDTLILSPISPKLLKGLAIDEGKNLLTFEVSDSASIYFKWDEVKNTLNAEQSAVISLFLADNKSLISYSALKEFADNTFSKTVKQWYDWAEKGNIGAYVTHRFDKTYSKTELEDKSKVEEIISMTNPANLEDETDVIDSVISKPLSVDSFKKLRVYFAWESDNGLNTSVSSHAFAPLYTPMASGYKLPYTPLFLLKAEDVNEKVSEEEKAFIHYFSLALLRNQGTNKTPYRDNTFQGTEYLD